MSLKVCLLLSGAASVIMAETKMAAAGRLNEGSSREDETAVAAAGTFIALLALVLLLCPFVGVLLLSFSFGALTSSTPITIARSLAATELPELLARLQSALREVSGKLDAGEPVPPPLPPARVGRGGAGTASGISQRSGELSALSAQTLVNLLMLLLLLVPAFFTIPFAEDLNPRSFSNGWQNTNQTEISEVMTTLEKAWTMFNDVSSNGQ